MREGQNPPGTEGCVSVLSAGGKGCYTALVCCKGGEMGKIQHIERREKRWKVKPEYTGDERPVRRNS